MILKQFCPQILQIKNTNHVGKTITKKRKIQLSVSSSFFPHSLSSSILLFLSHKLSRAYNKMVNMEKEKNPVYIQGPCEPYAENPSFN